jgi:hypothetical protein
MAKQRLDVFNIRKGKSRDGGERSYWSRCGVAFINKDGSINVKLELLPIDGELHLRAPRPRDESSQGTAPSMEQPF